MTEAGVMVIFALVTGGGTTLWFFYQLFGLDEIVKNWLASRKRAAYDAYIDSEVERRKVLLREMKRLGYDREDTMPEDLDKLRALFKEEFPVLYEDKE